MASLFDDVNSSDSEDDADYVPECSSDEEEEPIPAGSDDSDTEKPKRGKKKTSPDTEKAADVPKNTEEEQKKAKESYKSFLLECEAEMKARESESTATATLNSSGDTSVNEASCESTTNDVCESTTPAAKTAEEEKEAEIFEFAGETIAVSKEDGSLSVVASDDNSSKKPPVTAAAAKAPAVVKRKGLESVLGAIQNKKTKLSTLQKSMLDWNQFKRAEGIEEDLKKHNIGKEGFIERQRFLQRSDLRSYEIERDMRLSSRKKNT